MAKTNTRKYLIYGSIAAIVGVIGYYIWKSSKKDDKPKDDTPAPDNDGNEKDGKVNETPVKDKGNVGTPATAPTQAEIDLAKAYRTWANSTDALSLKWGKKSKYDLDATRTDPYGGTFLTSYNDGGKAEYEAYLKSKSGAGKTESQKAANKKLMDNLAFAWGGHPAVTRSTDARGRIMKFRFLPTWKSDGDYYWYLYFIETASGKTPPTYYITDGYNKEFQTGYWTFNGSKYSFNAVTGKNKGTKIPAIADLRQAVNKLGGEYVYNNIAWNNG